MKLPLVLALSVLTFSGSATAQSLSPTPKSTVVPSVLPGTSYIRLYGNDSGRSTDFEIRVVGTTSGIEYRTFTVSVPPYVSRQVNPHEIMAMSELRGGDTTVMAIITGKRAGLAQIAGLFQHVRFNQSTRILENISECSFNNTAYDLGYYRDHFVRQGSFLPHLHTSSLMGYDSYISITNPDSVEREFGLNAVNGADGSNPTANNPPQIVWGTRVVVPARSTKKIPVRQFEQQRDWTPRADQMHVNVNFSHIPRTGEPVYRGTAVVTHTVLDTAANVETNMSQYCPVEGVSITPSPLRGGSYGVTRSGSEYCINSGDEIASGCDDVIDHEASAATRGRIKGDISPTGGLGSGGAADGQIYPAGDVDWYRVRLERGGIYSIAPNPAYVSDGSALYKARARIRNANGQPVTMRSWELSRSDNVLLFTAEQTGDYFIEVEATDGESTGQYQLAVNSVFKADPCNPINGEELFASENQCNPSGADFPADDSTRGLLCINCGSLATSALTTASDVDWHRVYLTAGSTYLFDVDAVSTGSTSDPLFAGLRNRRIELINPAGTVLASDTGSISSQTADLPRCPITIPAPETQATTTMFPPGTSVTLPWGVTVTIPVGSTLTLPPGTSLNAASGSNSLPSTPVAPSTPPCVDPPAQQGDDVARIQFKATDTGYHYIAISSSDTQSFGNYRIVVTR